MKFFGPRDASQLAKVVLRVQRGVPAGRVLADVAFEDTYARQIAWALAGKKKVRVSREARAEARALLAWGRDLKAAG